MSLLGLDIGTTGTKAVAFDLEGRIIASAYREYPLHHPRPGWAELDPHEVWAAAEAVLAEVAGQTASDPVQAIGVSSQGEAGVPLDEAGRELYRSPISFDIRSLDQCVQLEDAVGRHELYQITGHTPAAVYTVPKLMWLKENEPNVFSKMRKFLCFQDYALFKLGGIHAMDWSLAGRTMAWDVRRKEWSSKICDAAGLDTGLFADAHPGGTAVGKILPDVAERLGLPKDVVLSVGGHDQPAAALGAGVVSGGVAMDGTGTVECITVAMSEPVFSDIMFDSSFCCYSHTATPLYVTLAYNFTGGNLFRWVRDVLGEAEQQRAEKRGVDVYQVLTEECSPEPSKLFVLPHFTSTGTPHFDTQAKGAILGLTIETTRPQLLRAFLEGITWEMRLCLELQQQAGVRIDRLRATGGGAKSPFWLQLKADMWNKPVEGMDVSEASCFGVALCAGAALGAYQSAADAAANLVRPTQVYEPIAANAAFYSERFEIYKDIYPTLRDLSHRM